MKKINLKNGLGQKSIINYSNIYPLLSNLFEKKTVIILFFVFVWFSYLFLFVFYLFILIELVLLEREESIYLSLYQTVFNCFKMSIIFMNFPRSKFFCRRVCGIK
jgi:hypothetical protein